MIRGSKNNPYKCPECSYQTTRKWSLKIHLEKVHGLAPFLPDRSQNEWVFAQLRHLGKLCAQAELDGDKEKQDRHWKSMITLFKYHENIFPIGRIPKIIKEERRKLEN